MTRAVLQVLEPDDEVFAAAAGAGRRSASWSRRAAIARADAASVPGKFILWKRISSPSLLNSLGGLIRSARGNTSNNHAAVNKGRLRVWFNYWPSAWENTWSCIIRAPAWLTIAAALFGRPRRQ